MPVYPAKPIKTRNGFIKFWTQNELKMPVYPAKEILNQNGLKNFEPKLYFSADLSANYF